MTNKQSNIPIHLQVAKYLRDDILNGVLKPGECIKAEKELCEMFSVSRGPVRQALDTLVKEQLIYRIAGKGTFVEEKPKPVKCAEVDVLNIGVFMDVVSEIQFSEFVNEMIQAMHSEAEQLYPKCHLSFQFHDTLGGVGEKFVEKTEFDGFLFVPIGRECIDFLAGLSARSVRPVVSFFRQVSNTEISQFYMDHEEGAYRATDYLIGRGHRRIATIVVSPISQRFDSRQRVQGYQRALKESNIPVDQDLVAQTDLTAAGLKYALNKLMKQSDQPTAILIGGQVLINPCTRMFLEMGLRIPKDISVVAFDDCTEAVMHNPPLTVVRQPYSRGIKLALEKLSAEIQEIEKDPICVAVKPELIVRDSCKSLR